MHLSEILTAELDAFRAGAGVVELDILETGTIRNVGENYRINDGWSTLTFAQYVDEHGGSVTSIDLDISSADKVLREHGVRESATLIEGYSVEILAGMVANAYARASRVAKGVIAPGGEGFADVVFLDSDNDGALILHEFMVARCIVRTPGLIMVDDVDLDSDGVVKGHKIVPWLESRGTSYRLEKRHGDDYTTGVLVIEV